MARIPGVQIEKDSKGRPAYARFNLKKHPEALELLNKIGAIEEDEFEREWNRRVSGSKVRKELHEHIDNLFNDKR
ncbi:MAG TPA: hypothetical protein VHO90_04655 [Bacteroidales bacterium]|nr:hypothetical protein [Bacteroidales bacterium]